MYIYIYVYIPNIWVVEAMSLLLNGRRLSHVRHVASVCRARQNWRRK